MAALLVIAAMCACLVPSPAAAAQNGPTWAYVWADDYTNAETYTPNQNYQFNSTGKPNTVTRTDVGVYTVNLPGMSKNGQVQLTTISENGELCKVVETKGVKGAVEETVNCVAIGGAPVDIGFQLLVVSGSLATPSAYLWANDPGTESYTPDERFQFNASGELNTITRTDVGTYTVTLPGQGAESGNIQVTAMAATHQDGVIGTSCAVRRWEIPDGNKQIEVNCFDATGTRVDSGFGLMYLDGSDAAAKALDSVITSGSYLLLNHDSANGRFTPGKDFQFSSAGAAGESERRELGMYTVYLPKVGEAAGTIQVSAYGKDKGTSCTVQKWTLNGSDYEVNVACFDGQGNAADSFFMLTYVVAAKAS